MRSKIVVAGLCAVALLVGSTGARAQIMGLFYQEVEKDGRVYVFNTPERAKMFAEGGEVGTSVTLPGKAVGGKTLVGENETAVDLYLFKHDLPGYERATPKPEKKFDERIYWKDGKTVMELNRAKIELSTRLQLRYSYFDQPDPKLEDRGTFFVRRAKTKVEALTNDKAWRFQFQTNWVGAGYLTGVTLAAASTPGGTPSVTSTVRRGPELEYAEVWWQKYPLTKVWVGQGKVPFERQQYTSSGRQQFVDRWIGDALYAPAMDQGVRIEGQTQNKTFEYWLGVYNGIARNINLNDNEKYMLSGRAVWTPFGEYALAESSLDYPDTPKLAIGAAFLDNTVGTGSSAVDIFRLGYEVAFKWRGFSAQGEYFDEEAENQSNVKSDNKGYYMQAGYLFPNRKFEVAARLENIERDSVFSVTNLGSTLKDFEGKGIGLSYYLDKHTHKIQGDYFQYEDKTTSRKLDEFRLQLQVIF